MTNGRFNRLIHKMQADHFDQLLICDPTAIAYLTGYHNEPYERLFMLLINTEGPFRLFLNRLFPEYRGDDLEVTWLSDTDDGVGIVASCLHPKGRIGVDPIMPSRFLLPLMGTVAADFQLSSVIDEMRMIKDPEEQDLMIRASLINDEAMSRIAEMLKGHHSEQAIADALLDIYQAQGASDYSFTPIIAYGAHGANPHHTTSSAMPQPGDAIICDIGCVYQGYCSDMTRTFFYQEVSERYAHIYAIVQKAQEAAVAAIRPGIPLRKIDQIARDIITAEGYGAYFTHRLGHFIGRSEHEYGDVSASSDLIATPGMIFSIEPGIYLPGEMGVRIEDLVMVTHDGCVRLNHFSRDLQILKSEETL